VIPPSFLFVFGLIIYNAIRQFSDVGPTSHDFACLFRTNSHTLLTFGQAISKFPTVRLASKLLSVSLWVKSTHTLSFYSRSTLFESRLNYRLLWFFCDFDQSPGNFRLYGLDTSLDITELHIWNAPGSKLGAEIGYGNSCFFVILRVNFSPTTKCLILLG
jgi:hypothetical protein